MKISYLWAKFFKKIKGKAVLNCEIDCSAVIYSGTQMVNSSLGRYSYVSYNCSIINASIGSFCSIASDVKIGGATHPISWVSTSPVFENVKNSGPNKRFARFELPPTEKTEIGSDVWVGNSVIIIAGVKIGHGAVIGAGAIVTKDVPPYAIVVGNPAKIIKYRFSQEIIEKLLASEWWTLPNNDIEKKAPYIRCPQEFIEQFSD